MGKVAAQALLLDSTNDATLPPPWHDQALPEPSQTAVRNASLSPFPYQNAAQPCYLPITNLFKVLLVFI